MQSKMVVVGGKDSYIDSFGSLNEFYDYLCNTPFNSAFRWARHASVDTSSYQQQWTQTESFDEAVLLMKRGWSDMAQKLVNKLKVIDKKTEMVTKRRSVNSVAGFHPVVPLYLAGVPTSMVSYKMVPVKQKIVNITKLLNYHGGISSETIIDESIKVLQIVKKLEAQGYSVNVNVAFGSSKNGRNIAASIRIKNANERLNVSKLAFPMVHPSMLRRLMFRYIEVTPNATNGYAKGYGAPVSKSEMQEMFSDSIVIPAIWDTDVNKIDTVDQIRGTV